MVWYGMVRYGMFWYGMVWYGNGNGPMNGCKQARQAPGRGKRNRKRNGTKARKVVSVISS